MTSIMTVVEDDEGRASRLALYNFAKPSANPRSVLPKGSMLAVSPPPPVIKVLYMRRDREQMQSQPASPVFLKF